MSANAGVWLQSLAKAVHPRVSKAVATLIEPLAAQHESDSPIAQLVRQLFFSASTPRHTGIFFVAAGTETDISRFNERVGLTLATLSGAPVAVVGRSAGGPAATIESRPRARHSTEFWRSATNRVADKLWSVSTEAFQEEIESHRGDETCELPFDYVLCGAQLNDSAAPLFSKVCDGAVLVLNANQTRRETALRAKEVLSSWNVKLLGAVLDNRTFPVPESIYRRL
jgi:hypothetical protein